MEDSQLRAVVEAKKLDLSCLTAKSQAEIYAKGMPDCHRLIVTDGVRYGVYIRGAAGVEAECRKDELVSQGRMIFGRGGNRSVQ